MQNNKKIVDNFFWRFLERISAQGITFIVSVVLARLLDPEIYGTVALVTAIITILNVLVDSGLGVSLIQKKDADDIDFSTVFWFNLTLCSVFYMLMFFGANLISEFYKRPELTNIVRVLSLCLIVAGIKNVQQAYVSRHLIFKKFFWATFGGTVMSAFVGIGMALQGFGVWALVFQNLTNQFFDTLILWLTVKWRPKFVFSVERFKKLFSFGYKLLLTSIIDTTYNQLRQLVLGKNYSSSDLAYYNQGYKYPSLIVVNIDTSIDSVLLPALSNEQDDLQRVKAMTRRAIKVSTYLLMPCLAGLAACAEPIITIMLTEKWLPCVPYLRIFCISYAMYPINTANLNAIKAIGRSDVSLQLEIIKKTIGFLSIIVAMNISPIALAYSLLFSSICAQFINAWPNKKLLGYSLVEQMKDIMPQTILSLIMLSCILCVGVLQINLWGRLGLQISVGIGIYIIGSIILKIDSFIYILNVLKNYKK